MHGLLLEDQWSQLAAMGNMYFYLRGEVRYAAEAILCEEEMMLAYDLNIMAGEGGNNYA